MSDFLDFASAFGKALPAIASTVVAERDKQRNVDVASAALTLQTLDGRVKSMREQAATIRGNKDATPQQIAQADALYAQADKLEALRPKAASAPGQFNTEAGAALAEPLKVGPSAGQVGAAVLSGLPQAAPVPITVTQGDVQASVTAATQAGSAVPGNIARANEVLKDTSGKYAPDVVAEARLYATSGGAQGDPTKFAGVQTSTATAEFVVANLTDKPRDALNAADQLIAAGKPTGLSDTAYQDLKRKVNNLNKIDELGIKGQETALEAAGLNMETLRWDLDKSKKAFALADLETKKKIGQAWIDGGNVEALTGLTDQEWTLLGLDKSASLTRAASQRAKLDKGVDLKLEQDTAALKALNINNESAQLALDTTKNLKGITDAATITSSLEKIASSGAGAVDTLKGLRATGVIKSDDELNAWIAKANDYQKSFQQKLDAATTDQEKNQLLVTNLKITNEDAQVSLDIKKQLAPLQVGEAQLKLDLQTKLQPFTIAGVQVSTLGEVVKLGSAGKGVLKGLLASGTITQDQYNEYAKAADDAQKLKDNELTKSNQTVEAGKQSLVLGEITIKNGQLSYETNQAQLDAFKTDNITKQKDTAFRWETTGNVDALLSSKDSMIGDGKVFATEAAFNAAVGRAQANQTRIAGDETLKSSILASQAAVAATEPQLAQLRVTAAQQGLALGEQQLENGKLTNKVGQEQYNQLVTTGEQNQLDTVKRWEDSGNPDALIGFKDKLLDPKGVFKWTQDQYDAAVGRAVSNRSKLEKTKDLDLQLKQGAVDLQGVNLDTAVASLDALKGQTRAVQDAEIAKYTDAGNVGLLKSKPFVDKMTALGYSAEDIKYFQDEAQTNYDLKNRTAVAAVDIQEAQATIAQQAADRGEQLKALYPTQDAQKIAEAEKAITDQGAIGYEIIQQMARDGTIDEPTRIRLSKIANDVQISNDKKRISEDTQFDTISKSAQSTYERLVADNTVAKAEDVSKIVALGNSGLGWLNDLYDKKLISVVQWNDAKKAMKLVQQGMDIKTAQQNQARADELIANWTKPGSTQSIDALKKSGQWAFVKQAYNMKDGDLEAYIKAQRTARAAEANDPQIAKDKAEATRVSNLWIDGKLDLSNPAEVKKLSVTLGGKTYTGAEAVAQVIKVLGITPSILTNKIEDKKNADSITSQLNDLKLTGAKLENDTTQQALTQNSQAFQVNLKLTNSQIDRNVAAAQASLKTAQGKNDQKGIIAAAGALKTSIGDKRQSADSARKAANAIVSNKNYKNDPTLKKKYDDLIALAAKYDQDADDLQKLLDPIIKQLAPSVPVPKPTGTGTGTGTGTTKPAAPGTFVGASASGTVGNGITQPEKPNAPATTLANPVGPTTVVTPPTQWTIKPPGQNLRGDANKNSTTLNVYVPLDKVGFLPLTRDEYSRESNVIAGIKLIKDPAAKVGAVESFIEGIITRYGLQPSDQVRAAIAAWVNLILKGS
jgi:hypothetical protein